MVRDWRVCLVALNFYGFGASVGIATFTYGYRGWEILVLLGAANAILGFFGIFRCLSSEPSKEKKQP
jgi:hypothetical protein